LHSNIPIKHWNREGSQHPINEDGIGRGDGLGVTDVEQIGAIEGRVNRVGSQHVISSKLFINVGIGVYVTLQIGANEGHIENAGSQHAPLGMVGNPVPPPGHCGTKSGHGNFSGSQHAPLGIGGNDGIADVVKDASQGGTSAGH
jgi:hypothetical protein